MIQAAVNTQHIYVSACASLYYFHRALVSIFIYFIFFYLCLFKLVSLTPNLTDYIHTYIIIWMFLSTTSQTRWAPSRSDYFALVKGKGTSVELMSLPYLILLVQMKLLLMIKINK